MINAWHFVDADDDLVADLLAATVEVVFELGGSIHPQTRILARNGQLSIASDAQDGEPLVHLPAEAFVRIGQVVWSPSADQLESEGLLTELGPAETELLILQTALHNACGKVPWLVDTHPVLASDLSAEVVDAVRAFRPSFRRRQPTPASLFWSNRVFRLPPPGSQLPEPLALPIIDLLDHHHSGATGTWTGSAFTVATQRPTGHAALLNYGLRRDAIGMAVVYGFADVDCPVAHSAPIEVEVPGVGVVRVLAKGRDRAGTLLAPVVHDERDVTTISHVTFDAGQPGAAAAALSTAATWSAGLSAAVVDAVAERNVRLLDDLVERTASSHGAAASTLREAALRQRAVIAACVS